MSDQPTFSIIAEVQRDGLPSAIALTEQLVEHGYVEMARVVADSSVDPNLLDAHIAELDTFDFDAALAALEDTHDALVRLWNALAPHGHMTSPNTGKVEVMQAIVDDLTRGYQYGKTVFGGGR